MTDTPPHFADELAELKQSVVTMGELAADRLAMAISGLVARDRDLLADVVGGDARLDTWQIQIDEHCFTLLARHQPVASDLRTIVSALRINTDVERVGDLAVNVAEAAERYLVHPPVKPLIDLPRMGELAVRMLRDALGAFTDRDVSLAHNVLQQLAWLNVLRNQVFRELLTYMLGNPRVIEPSVELILISRQVERVGEHATNVAEDVVFLVEARDIRHRTAHAPGAERRGPADVAPL
ncbi:MAG TPA: phosphate signaling complex protein PhoU [Vicinamibacterales bacterium]|jgi:phosphate transport system protein|nr:phosphate signaling complex protein PhoU [Vicinamibacterales bacterium]